MIERIEKRILSLFKDAPPPILHALQYSLVGGGRIRPLLVLATTDYLGGDSEAALDPAIAIELLHTFSLIQDDLPCMDNDDLRRGRPTLHKECGEWQALLVSDLLYNESIRLITTSQLLSPAKKLKLLQLLTEKNGYAGLIGGQWQDLSIAEKNVSASERRECNSKKTGALFQLSFLFAAVISSATERQENALATLGLQWGLAYQLQDDIEDGMSSKEQEDELNNLVLELIHMTEKEFTSPILKKFLDKIFSKYLIANNK